MTNWNDIPNLTASKCPIPWCIVFRIIGRSIVHQARIFLVISVLWGIIYQHLEKVDEKQTKNEQISLSGCFVFGIQASLSVCLQCCQVFQASKFIKALKKHVDNRWHFSINQKVLCAVALYQTAVAHRLESVQETVFCHTHWAKSHHLVLQIFIVYFLQGFKHTSKFHISKPSEIFALPLSWVLPLLSKSNKHNIKLKMLHCEMASWLFLDSVLTSLLWFLFFLTCGVTLAGTGCNGHPCLPMLQRISFWYLFRLCVG